MQGELLALSDLGSGAQIWCRGSISISFLSQCRALTVRCNPFPTQAAGWQHPLQERKCLRLLELKVGSQGTPPRPPGVLAWGLGRWMMHLWLGLSHSLTALPAPLSDQETTLLHTFSWGARNLTPPTQKVTSLERTWT